MPRKAKPLRMWMLARHGSLCDGAIRRTRHALIVAAASNKSDWDNLRIRGYRAVRVSVLEDWK